jgi:hypothetical protein
MLPPGLPDRNDVESAVFEDLLTGALKREDVKAPAVLHCRPQSDVSDKYAKFGISPWSHRKTGCSRTGRPLGAALLARTLGLGTLIPLWNAAIASLTVDS